MNPPFFQTISTAMWAATRVTFAAGRIRPRSLHAGTSTRASASPSTIKDAMAIAIASARRKAAMHAAAID